MDEAHQPSPVIRWQDDEPHYLQDDIAREEALSLVIAYYSKGHLVEKSLGLTMRTPGHDEDMLYGFLFHEGIIDEGQAIDHITTRCTGQRREIVATLHPHIEPDLSSTQRHTFLTASCGLCGKQNLQELREANPTPGEVTIRPQVLHRLPQLLEKHQSTFSRTGGLHAAALFSPTGSLLACFEDIGRHNALDKLSGHFLAAAQAHQLQQNILLLSGRVSFEMVQKSQQAQIPIIASVGAPSSLAIASCLQSGITLIGFLRKQRFNVYSMPQRVLTKSTH